MKLREITRRPQLDEFTWKGENSDAAKWWQAKGPKIVKGLGIVGSLFIVYDIWDTFRKVADMDCEGMPENECKAAQRAIIARLVAHYGIGYVLFVIGGIAGGFITGPAAWAGSIIGASGAIVAYLVAEVAYGADVDQAIDWIVKKASGMNTSRPMAYPPEKRKSPEVEPYKGNPKQQAYRQGQVGMDTANNPDPRLHPERYPQD
jgi:hypothetical protein